MNDRYCKCSTALRRKHGLCTELFRFAVLAHTRYALAVFSWSYVDSQNIILINLDKKYLCFVYVTLDLVIYCCIGIGYGLIHPVCRILASIDISIQETENVLFNYYYFTKGLVNIREPSHV